MIYKPNVLSGLSNRISKPLEIKSPVCIIHFLDFKKDLVEVLVCFLQPIQKQYNEYLRDEGYLIDILKDGALRAQKIAQVTLAEVEERIGVTL